MKSIVLHNIVRIYPAVYYDYKYRIDEVIFARRCFPDEHEESVRQLNVQNRMCAYRRLKSALTATQSDLMSSLGALWVVETIDSDQTSAIKHMYHKRTADITIFVNSVGKEEN